jgi:hypothetical protein
MGRPAINHCGSRFGDLVAVARIEMAAGVEKYITRIGRNSVWLCICVCGRWVPVVLTNLVSGNTTSCGCRRGETRAALNRASSRDWHGRLKPGTTKNKL